MKAISSNFAKRPETPPCPAPILVFRMIRPSPTFRARIRATAKIGTDPTIMLTGPVPVTQAITERSFQEFWNVFPIGVVLCAVMIFVLHKRIRAVLIAGVPTLYGIFFTYGVIGWWGREVTPTIIALGPILMALGVAYGLHLTNRFTEERGADARERMMRALSTTGRAIVLSAVTTMIGFGSLMYTNLDPEIGRAHV